MACNQTGLSRISAAISQQMWDSRNLALNALAAESAVPKKPAATHPTPEFTSTEMVPRRMATTTSPVVTQGMLTPTLKPGSDFSAPF